jgi:hypothetical protein
MAFQNRPPSVITFRCLDLVRCPPRGGLRGLLTCERSIGTYTHYFGGKTVPCGDSLCAACDAQCAKRWHSYVSLYTPAPEKHVICEITLAAAEELWAFEDQNESIREAHLTLSRRGDRDNGRVSTAFSWAHKGKLRLPYAPDLEQQLRVIWGLELREKLANTTPADVASKQKATRETRINGTRAT